ncbi:response regulator [Sphingomonas sp.]|uniref:response regulator n=1 Tax=Sphingomonas sp. TaxID=28214 RepID=UPI00345C4C97
MGSMLFARKKPVLQRVLIVEDEPVTAFDTQHLLSHEGYGVVATTDTAASAVALIESGATIDLVVADICLADGTGLEVARAARARQARTLFVTTKCPPEAQDVADGWLAKPYRQRDLLAAIGVIEQVSKGDRPQRMPRGLTLFEPGACP